MGSAPKRISRNISPLDYRSLFEAAPGLYLILDADLTIMAVNRAYAHATMIDPTVVLGRALFDVFPDNPGDPTADGVRNLRASLTRVMQTKRPDAMAVQKYDIRKPDGEFEERHWSPLNVPVLAVDGGVRWIIHRVEDVTDLVRLQSQSVAQDQIARDQLRLIEEMRSANTELAQTLAENTLLQRDHAYLASIVESSADAIIGKTLAGIITSWNRAAEVLFGHKAAEIIGRPVALLFPPDLLQEEDAIIARVKRGEMIAHYETVRLRKDGRPLQVSLTVSPIRDSAGTIIGASKIVRDITAQKEAEDQIRALQAERSFLADLVESSNDAIVARSNDGTIRSWNRAAEQTFGYSAAEMIGQPAVLPSDQDREASEVFERLKRGEHAVHYETKRLHKDGSEVQVSFTASLIRNQQGEVVGTSGILRDISEQRRTAERLQNLQDELVHLSRWNMMGMMASTIAHELNQPLTATINYVRAARRTITAGASDVERTVDFLDRAVDEAKLAGGIIRSLREFIDKRESGRNREDINVVVEESISLSLLGGHGRKVRARVELGPLLPPVLIDKIQIEQVLLNLIRNAVEAIGDQSDGELRIATHRDDPEFICVSVSDTGPGLAPEIAQQLFQPFVTTKDNGMGVGLTICQSIIEAHGGTIWSEPVVPQGVTFRFRLPAAKAAA